MDERGHHLNGADARRLLISQLSPLTFDEETDTHESFAHAHRISQDTSSSDHVLFREVESKFARVRATFEEPRMPIIKDELPSNKSQVDSYSLEVEGLS